MHRVLPEHRVIPSSPGLSRFENSKHIHIVCMGMYWKYDDFPDRHDVSSAFSCLSYQVLIENRDPVP